MARSNDQDQFLAAASARPAAMGRPLAAAALIFCLCLAFGAAAQTPAPTTDAPAVTTAPAESVAAPDHTKPFGALTLYALAGTLFVGLIAGIGLGGLRGRGKARPEFRSEPRIGAQPAPRAATPARIEPEPDPYENEEALPVLARITVPVAPDTGPRRAIARLVDRLSRGPSYGPRIMAFASDIREHEAMVIAQIAEAARRENFDVAIVDAAETPDDLIADELDLIVDDAHGFDDEDEGHRAKIEIVPVDHLIPAGRRPGLSALRHGMADLAGRADIILVRTSERPLTPAIFGAVDEIVLLQDAQDWREEASILDSQSDIARYRDRLAGTILVSDRAA